MRISGERGEEKLRMMRGGSRVEWVGRERTHLEENIRYQL